AGTHRPPPTAGEPGRVLNMVEFFICIYTWYIMAGGCPKSSLLERSDRVLGHLQHDRVVALDKGEHRVARALSPGIAAVERLLLLAVRLERREGADQVRLLVPVLGGQRRPVAHHPDTELLQQRHALLAHEADELLRGAGLEPVGADLEDHGDS